MARWVRFTLIFMLLLVVSYFGVHHWAKSRIEGAIKSKIPASWMITYDDLEFNLLAGDIEFKNLSMHLQDSSAVHSYFDLRTKELLIKDVSYSELIEENTLKFKRFELDDPSILLKPYARVPDSLRPAPTPHQKLKVTLGELLIKDGKIGYFSKASDTIGTWVSRFDLRMNAIATIDTKGEGMLPFEFGDFEMELDSLTQPLGAFEKLLIEQVKIGKDSLHFKNLYLATKVDTKAFSKLLDKERDHFNLYIPEMKILHMGIQKESERMTVALPHLKIQQPSLQVYRDKLLPDDFSTKTFFSEKFRNLPFTLKLDSLEVVDADIKYTEKDQYTTEGGHIEFLKMNLNAAHLGNGYPEGTHAKIEGNGLFMNTAPITFHWEFDPLSINDTFTFSAEVDRLPASDINALTANNMNVLFDGQINRCFFSINGNNYHSRYNFNIKYEDLTVDILNRKKGKSHWLGTKLANLLLKKNSKTKMGNIRQHSGDITRIQHKGFFNYLWRNVEDGLIHTLL